MALSSQPQNKHLSQFIQYLDKNTVFSPHQSSAPPQIGIHQFLPHLCTMNILIVSATQQEIAPFAEALPQGFRGHQVEALITGIGMLPAACHLHQKLAFRRTDLVIQAGIAGSYNPDFPPGQVVTVLQDTIGDLGAETDEQFTPLHQMGFQTADDSLFTQGWLINKDLQRVQPPYPAVRGITVNRITDSDLARAQMVAAWQPDIETMEGAALHYVCLQQQLAFLQLRSISNEVGVRDKSRWKTQEAIHNLNTALLQMLRTIPA
jgi:futalosine hydrolase